MLKILYCNIYVVGRTGTEIVTVEAAKQLKRQGHDVAVFASGFGSSASDLAGAGIPMITRTCDIPWVPDIVHSNHWPQSMLVAAAFPLVPQVFECHDPRAWHSAPPTFPCVQAWIAVDEICRDRVVEEASANADQVSLLANAVDLERYPLRVELPQKATTSVGLDQDF